MGVGDVDGPPQRADGVGVLAAQVDVALGRADRERRDRHPLDERERVALDEHPVGEGAAVALVGVAADELHVGGGGAHRLPLDAGGEAGAAATAQPGRRHLGDDLLGGERQRPFQPAQPAVLAVGGEVGRLDDADPGERDAVLTGQPVVLVDDPDAALGVVERAVEERPDLGLGEVAVPDPAALGLDLDERLEPQHPSRAVAAHRDPGGRDGVGDGIRTEGDGGGVAGHPGGRHRHHPPVRASSRSGDSAACRAPSTVPDGPTAHSPRQNTSPTSTSAEPDPAVGRDGVQALGATRLAGLAAAQRDPVRGRGSAAEVVVEGHDAVHVGAREVEHLGDHQHVVVGDVPVGGDDLVQHRQQRPAQRAQLLGDGPHGRRPLGVRRGGCRCRAGASLTHVRRLLCAECDLARNSTRARCRQRPRTPAADRVATRCSGGPSTSRRVDAARRRGHRRDLPVSAVAPADGAAQRGRAPSSSVHVLWARASAVPAPRGRRVPRTVDGILARAVSAVVEPALGLVDWRLRRAAGVGAATCRCRRLHRGPGTRGDPCCDLERVPSAHACPTTPGAQADHRRGRRTLGRRSAVTRHRDSVGRRTSTRRTRGRHRRSSGSRAARPLRLCRTTSPRHAPGRAAGTPTLVGRGPSGGTWRWGATTNRSPRSASPRMPEGVRHPEACR